MIMIEDPKPGIQKEKQKPSPMETNRSIRDVVRDLVNELQDNEVISIPLEGMVVANGQKTE